MISIDLGSSSKPCAVFSPPFGQHALHLREDQHVLPFQDLPFLFQAFLQPVQQLRAVHGPEHWWNTDGSRCATQPPPKKTTNSYSYVRFWMILGWFWELNSLDFLVLFCCRTRAWYGLIQCLFWAFAIGFLCHFTHTQLLQEPKRISAWAVESIIAKWI